MKTILFKLGLVGAAFKTTLLTCGVSARAAIVGDSIDYAVGLQGYGTLATGSTTVQGSHQ